MESVHYLYIRIGEPHRIGLKSFIQDVIGHHQMKQSFAICSIQDATLAGTF
jgi:hypothetical protein